MLLPTATRQQPRRTTTLLRHQRHRQGYHLLASETSTTTCTSSSTLAFSPRLDQNNFDASSLRTLRSPRTTIPHCKLPLLASCSPNTPPSWTAYATTKKQLPNGLQEPYHNVHALHFNALPTSLLRKINTSFWMATNSSSMTAHSHPFLQDPFRTKYFHHPKKSTRHYFLPFRRGPLAIHYLLSLETPSKHCGYRPFVNIMLPFAITSPTRTLPASNNNSLKLSSTMRTNVPRHYGCTAQSFIIDVLQPHLLTPWSSRSWRTTLSSSSSIPSPTSKSNLANSTLGHWEPARTYRMLTFFPNGKNSSWLEDPL